MKIGIDCRLFSSTFTGIGRYTHELVDHYIDLNNKLDKPHQLVLFFNKPEFKKFKAVENVKKVLVDAKHYSFAEQTKFLFKLNKEKLDIVHFPHFNVPIFYRRPYVVTIHDLTLNFFPGQKMTKFYHRFAYNLTIKNATRRAKKIIAISKNTKNDLIEILNIDPKKIEIVYNGIDERFKLIQDTSKFKKTLKKYKISKQFLLYTGVWRNHKNLPRLLKAFKMLKEEKNLDLQLVITGKEDPHYPEVKKTVKKLNITEDIIFPGLVDDEELIQLYNAAFIFVFPSLYEGFGLPPLESMRCGTPVAASNISSIPEVCGEENAIYFDPYSATDIAEKIYSLYIDTAKQAELVEKGIKHSAKLSWTTTAEQTFKLITNV